MGRHSAAEEEGSDLLGMREPRRPEDAERGQLLLARGRHAVPDTAESADPEPITHADTTIVETAADGVAAPRADNLIAAEPAAATPSLATPTPTTPSPAKQSRAKGRPGGTRADVQLMRRNPEVLARCIAGLLVPFVLYTVALLVTGATGSYLIWIWVPAIVAGVLVGAFLDSAHKRDRP